jgi:hypothetical protein
MSLQTDRLPGSGAAAGVSREFLFVLAICLFDTVSSAYLFHRGMAVEANPLLLPFAEAGTAPFLTARTLTFLPALLACEWYRRQNPQFVSALLRGTGILYLGIYLTLVVRQFGG